MSTMTRKNAVDRFALKGGRRRRGFEVPPHYYAKVFNVVTKKKKKKTPTNEFFSPTMKQLDLLRTSVAPW